MTQIRLQPQSFDPLAQEARRNGRTPDQEAELAIRHWLEEHQVFKGNWKRLRPDGVLERWDGSIAGRVDIYGAAQPGEKTCARCRAKFPRIQGSGQIVEDVKIIGFLCPQCIKELQSAPS